MGESENIKEISDISLKTSSFQNQKQQRVFDLIVNSLRKAHIPVILCSDEEMESKLRDNLRLEYLRLPNKGKDFDDTLANALNFKGVVASGLADRIVNIVDIERHNFNGSANEAIKAAKLWSLTNLVGYHSAHEGELNEFQYYIDRHCIEKVLSEKATSKSDNIGIQIALLKYFPKLIENSIDVEIHPDYKKTDDIRNPEIINSTDKLIHRLYGAIRLEGKIYRVKTTMYEFRIPRTKAYTYEIKNMRLSEGGPILGETCIPSVDNAPVDNLKISCAKLLKGIEKTNEPGKKILEESVKLEKELSRIFVNVTGNRCNSNGKIYGWTQSGVIYLTKSGLNPYTPLHEYTHLWAKAMQCGNPEGWLSIVEKLEGTPIWKEVLHDSNYSNLDTEDKIASEALARISSYVNYEKLESLANRTMQGSDISTLLKDFQSALETFWTWTAKELLDIKQFSSVEEVCDRIIFDLTKGEDIRLVKDNNAEYQIVTRGGKYNYDCGNGKVLCSVWLDSAEPFKDGRARCVVGSTQFEIDTKGIILKKETLKNGISKGIR